MDVVSANDYQMNDLRKRIRAFLLDKGQKNAALRDFLAETCQEQRTKNCFAWGSLRIQLDPDSPIKGVYFQERVYVSIYDQNTDTIMRFDVPVDAVQFEESAMGEE